MGGDFGPSITVPAAVSFANQTSDVELILVGREEAILAALAKHKATSHPRITVRNATEVVEMDDPVEVALRRKKDSSMRVAVSLVKEGLAQTAVSAGNTGALMAVSRYVLKTLPGVDRPAICTILPNQNDGPTYMLDLGANVDCEAEHLRQFALMGSALVGVMEGKSKPTVGLLNIGEEEIKGNELVKATAVLLRHDHEKGIVNFYGNVEGNDIFEGTTDIVVCDGFVGNVALKTTEGVGRFVKTVLTAEFKRGIINKIGALIAYGALKAMSKRLNPSRYNGASLLGLRGLVFKSHGGADAYAFEWAIKRAYNAAKYDVLSRIVAVMAELIPQATPADAADPASGEPQQPNT